MDGWDGREALCDVPVLNYDCFPVLRSNSLLASCCFPPGYRLLSTFASHLKARYLYLLLH